MSSPSWHLYWVLISLLGWAGSLLMVVTLSDQWPSKAIILRNAPSLTCNDSHYLRYVMRGSIFVDQTLHELLELCCGPMWKERQIIAKIYINASHSGLLTFPEEKRSDAPN